MAKLHFMTAVCMAAMAFAGPAVAETAATSPAAQQLAQNYVRVTGWPQLPETLNGGRWGEVSALDAGPDGTIWVIHRCFGREPRGGATCIGRDQFPPILQFDRSGKLLRQFGNGLFAFVHGSYVDREGNVWVTDTNEDDTVMGMSTQNKGAQVFKFSPYGKLLMKLGKAGVRKAGRDTFVAPTDVVTAPNGDIFVTDGHLPDNGADRVVQFSKKGKFIKQWGGKGSKPGQFDRPHTIAIDSQGRIIVGDRGNARIQVFDQNGKFLAAWTQFGRPSGIAIGSDDTLYVTDSMSTSENNPGRKRGVYIGSLRTGEVTAFIPDPDLDQQDKTLISGATGITVHSDGTVFLGDVGPAQIRVYKPCAPGSAGCGEGK